jgi:hypothetical protein
MKKIFIISIISLLIPLISLAQHNSNNITLKKDSLAFYKKIKGLSSKRKFTRWVYEAIFKDSTSNYIVTPKVKADDYDKYQGKIIRKIEIVSLDPFGTSVNYPDRVIENPLMKTGNKLHSKSKELILKNQLLIKKGEALDPLSLRESERILRKTTYIRDAKISITPIKNSRDSVDIVVVVQNLWSLLPTITSDGPYYAVSLQETNFMGLGQGFQNSVTFRPDSLNHAVLNGSYSIPNIKHSFITAIAYYSTSTTNSVKGMSVNRKFYSPLTKWAGGIDQTLVSSTNPYLPSDALNTSYSIQYRNQDYWFGRSFKLHPGHTDAARSSRLVIAGRLLNIHYTERPTATVDSLHIFQHNTFYLGSVGYSTSKYYKDEYIFRFAINEDVPEGSLFTLIGGLEKKELFVDYYIGAKAAAGRHFENIGYLSGGAEYGTFFKSLQTQRGVINLDFTYISDRLKINRYGIRQFIYYHLTEGIQRQSYETVNINGNKGLYGFESNTLRGKSKIYLNLQSVIFTPWNLVGFQFAPVVFAGFGMMSGEPTFSFKSPIYQVYGIGVLVRNENLIINSFRFSLAFYPNEPGRAGLDFKINPFGAYDLRFNDFFLSKPGPVAYQ